MPQKKKLKLSRRQILYIVLAGLALVAVLTLIILNAYIPVKYLSAYLVSKNLNEQGRMRVNFIDVGNSDCTVVELPDGKTLLIDGCDGTYLHNLKVLKELNSRGINDIDYLICSSVENAACGGLAEILKYKNVDKIFAPYCPVTHITDGYKSFCEEVERLGKEISFCEYGAGVFNDDADYYFCFLSPDYHLYENGEYAQLITNPTSQNIKNASAVIWLECCGVSFLFLGSTGQAVQQKLIEEYNFAGIDVGGRKIDLTACDVVKMSDHGSTEGAFAPFLDLIKPRTAIISVGDNGNGCPTLAALANAQNVVGNSLYRTDELGTVTIEVKDGNYGIFKEKK
ncbi:MAG: hypothetical protein K2O89_00830 [Clostridia bacterium]|nr:hypothetical protein [Clostridia bacterium]